MTNDERTTIERAHVAYMTALRVALRDARRAHIDYMRVYDAQRTRADHVAPNALWERCEESSIDDAVSYDAVVDARSAYVDAVTATI